MIEDEKKMINKNFEEIFDHDKLILENRLIKVSLIPS